MSAAGERQRARPEDTRVSGAKPKPEGRVRERGWRPTRRGNEVRERPMEAARRRAIERGRQRNVSRNEKRCGGRE
jgi:hypothetical protein